MKVLLIDDNPDITGLLSKFLTAKGYENVVTNNPQKGLHKIIDESYDVVFLDIQMPQFSGLEIIKKLESENVLKDQKIIIFSAHNFNTPEINELLKKEGISACLKKPIHLNKLLTTMVK